VNRSTSARPVLAARLTRSRPPSGSRPSVPRRWRTSGCAQNLPARIATTARPEPGRELVHVPALDGERVDADAVAGRAHPARSRAARRRAPPRRPLRAAARAARSARSRARAGARARSRARRRRARSACRPRRARARSFHSMSSSETDAVAPPPHTSGGPDSRNRVGETSTPEPNGANSLWPENAQWSTPSAASSSARCGASWAASRQSSAPASCASRDQCAMSGTCPVTFEAPDSATIRTRPRSRRAARRGGRCRGCRRRACARGGSHPAPRQQVRVVLRGRRQHDGALAVLVQAQARDLVQPVGRVSGEHDRLVGTCADEPVHGRARALVRVRRHPRTHAGAAVDRPVPRQQLEHPRDDAGERGRRRCVVEVRLLLGRGRRAEHVQQGSTRQHPRTVVDERTATMAAHVARSRSAEWPRLKALRGWSTSTAPRRASGSRGAGCPTSRQRPRRSSWAATARTRSTRTAAACSTACRGCSRPRSATRTARASRRGRDPSSSASASTRTGRRRTRQQRSR